jgi:hypothetical protein
VAEIEPAGDALVQRQVFLRALAPLPWPDGSRPATMVFCTTPTGAGSTTRSCRRSARPCTGASPSARCWAELYRVRAELLAVAPPPAPEADRIAAVEAGFQARIAAARRWPTPCVAPVRAAPAGRSGDQRLRRSAPSVPKPSSHKA